MRKLIVSLVLILVLLVPAQIQAQEAVTITSLEVDLWPEYDRAEMLVIYRIELSPDVSLPVDVRLRIPAEAGEPNAVAIRDTNGDLLNAPSERQVLGDWAYITITATFPSLQLEYYDPQLTKNGSERHFEYEWLSDYPVDSFQVIAQEPIGTTQMTTNPRPSQVTPGSEGLTYDILEMGAIPAGQPATVTLDYVKENDILSIEGRPVEPSAPISSDTPGRVNLLDIVPWVLGSLGVLLVVGGIWWYWKSGREQPKAGKRRRRSQSPGKPKRTPSSEDDAVYCHQCGKRARPEDRFCRSCGSKLRSG